MGQRQRLAIIDSSLQWSECSWVTSTPSTRPPSSRAFSPWNVRRALIPASINSVVPAACTTLQLPLELLASMLNFNRSPLKRHRSFSRNQITQVVPVRILLIVSPEQTRSEVGRPVLGKAPAGSARGIQGQRLDELLAARALFPGCVQIQRRLQRVAEAIARAALHHVLRRALLVAVDKGRGQGAVQAQLRLRRPIHRRVPALVPGELGGQRDQ